MMEPEPESAESVIRRICRALSMVDGFALYFVLVNLPSARRAIALQVIEQVERPVIEMDVPSEGFGDTTLDGWLLPKLEELEEQDGVTAETAIFLHGLDRVMPTGQSALCHFLQLLNWRRGALKQIARPLVIWLPRHALDSMAEHAPDLYDWYSNVYEFASPKEEAEELRSGFLTEFSTAVHPAERLSKKEKERWLHTLTALLDEHPQRNAYRAKLLDDAGRVYKASGNLEDALALHQQALAISREIGDRRGEGVTLNNISQIYHDRGDYATALKYLEQSLSISREIDDKAGEGARLNNLAATAYAKGDYATALKYLEQSLAICKEIDHKAGEGRTLSNIGVLHHTKGDYAKALPLYEQSLAICHEIDDKAQEALTSWNMGRAYEDQGDMSKAESYMSRAVQLAEEIGHPSLEKYRKGLEELRAKLRGQ
jgi:tetratricopeptide (TPR) repeat protein